MPSRRVRENRNRNDSNPRNTRSRDEIEDEGYDFNNIEENRFENENSGGRRVRIRRPRGSSRRPRTYSGEYYDENYNEGNYNEDNYNENELPSSESDSPPPPPPPSKPRAANLEEDERYLRLQEKMKKFSLEELRDEAKVERADKEKAKNEEELKAQAKAKEEAEKAKAKRRATLTKKRGLFSSVFGKKKKHLDYDYDDDN